MSDWPNRVSIGGFVADVNSPTDSRLTTKITGWGSAPVRLDAQDRAQQDGGFDSQPVRSARLITVEGYVDQPTHAAAQAVSDELCSLSLRQLHEFAVDNEAIGSRSAMVRVAAAVEPDWDTSESFSYVLQLWAPDSLKYGPAWFGSTTLAGSAGAGIGRVWPRAWPRDWGVPAGVTPGSVTVPNAGTAPYWTRLRIDGPVLNPVVRCLETGDWVKVGANVVTGQWVDVDTGERHVTYGANADDLRYLTDASGLWLVVPPGGATFTYEADSADAASTLTVFGYEGAWD